MTIANNTISTVRWATIGLRGKESTNGRILNNILCDAERSIIDGDSDFSYARPTIAHNLTFRTSPVSGQKNINGEDPRFVDPSRRNFRLRNGSPAVGAGEGGMTIGALEYPNVFYVDPRHPAASDELGWGYPAVPLASLAKACSLAQPGETIVLRGGVYRETLRPKCDGITVRSMQGEKVTISGADLIGDWKREEDGRWSAPVLAKPEKVLRDSQTCSEFAYDQVAKRIEVREADPRLHLFETVAREQAIDLSNRKKVKIEGITVTNLLGGVN